MNNYVSRKEVLKHLKIHPNTLSNYVKLNKIQAISTGTKLLYNLELFMKINGYINNKLDICYCRVSCYKHKLDLNRQIEYMKEKYPKNIIISDIGNSLNFNRQGLNKILDMAINGKKII